MAINSSDIRTMSVGPSPIVQKIKSVWLTRRAPCMNVMVSSVALILSAIPASADLLPLPAPEYFGIVELYRPVTPSDPTGTQSSGDVYTAVPGLTITGATGNTASITNNYGTPSLTANVSVSQANGSGWSGVAESEAIYAIRFNGADGQIQVNVQGSGYVSVPN